MKKLLRYIAMATLLMASATAWGQTRAEGEALDTVYFYKTWQQMLEFNPEAYLINPFFDAVSPYEVYFATGDEKIDNMIHEDYIAFSQGDSIWLINSEYLNKHFKGDSKHLNGFAPVFFNQKTACVVAHAPLSVKDILFGTNADGVTSFTPVYYNIDFLNQRVRRVNSDYLSELLEDYHDLQMRYEGMKDYKKDYIIEDYYFKYIDRASEDFMHPNILDLVE